MSVLRKTVDEKDARRCLARLARSGETLRSWARSNGVDGRSLRAWQINMSRRGPPEAFVPTTTRLVELVPTSEPASMVSDTKRYVVRVGAYRVELGDDFEAAALRRIVEVLGSC